MSFFYSNIQEIQGKDPFQSKNRLIANKNISTRIYDKKNFEKYPENGEETILSVENTNDKNENNNIHDDLDFEKNRKTSSNVKERSSGKHSFDNLSWSQRDPTRMIDR